MLRESRHEPVEAAVKEPDAADGEELLEGGRDALLTAPPAIEREKDRRDLTRLVLKVPSVIAQRPEADVDETGWD
jgi:hypothetical protein